MSLAEVVYSLVMLLFVVGLIMLSAVLMKKFQQKYLAPGHHNASRRLGVLEVLRLDHKRQLMLIKRDQQEHLLLLSSDSEIIIESNIK